MTKEEQIKLGHSLLLQMRKSFGRGAWGITVNDYERLILIKTDRATRLEATCLAARSLVASKDRSSARKVLETVSKGEYKKSVHYEFLARAHLDLKQYKECAAACERAEQLRGAPVKSAV